MIKTLKILIILSFIVAAGAALAQDTTPSSTSPDNSLENAQAEDLEVAAPKILPDSPFYFLKNWARGIQMFLATDPVKKVELKAKFSDERLSEIQKMVGQNKGKEKIEKALEKYKDGLDKVKEAAEKIKEKTQDSDKINKFLDKFVKQQALQQGILDKLQNQVPEQVFEKIKEAREKHLERFKEVMTKLETDKEKLKERLKMRPPLLSGIKEECEANQGKWLSQYKECEGAKEDWCKKVGGEYEDCTSACRHNPDPAALCTKQCVPVCQLEDREKVEGSADSANGKKSGNCTKESACQTPIPTQ